MTTPVHRARRLRWPASFCYQEARMAIARARGELAFIAEVGEPEDACRAALVSAAFLLTEATHWRDEARMARLDAARAARRAASTQPTADSGDEE